ncbi:type II toxin-antitoxin system PemK/MazF family toxin [Streptococcus pyogenes]|uniref:type II toxin-antitoxin system PemK/MazF family toxin n=1 Tax=Streptococcus pyogenes TaxID=1314 RepID=UPI003204B449
MNDIEIYSVLVSRIDFADGAGSKIRPAVVVKFNDEVIKTLRLTTKYENKSDYIKSQYLEVIDWAKANLKRRSWIDTIQYYDIEDKGFNIKIIGKLSDRDIERLKDFLRERGI